LIILVSYSLEALNVSIDVLFGNVWDRKGMKEKSRKLNSTEVYTKIMTSIVLATRVTLEFKLYCEIIHYETPSFSCPSFMMVPDMSSGMT
jgi:hypothetical protein